MPVPVLISELSLVAASNFPAGSDSPASLDDTQRAHAGFIAQLRDGKAELAGSFTQPFAGSTITPRTSATGSATIPAGTTAQRDTTPATGFLRYNSTIASFEGYSGTAWGSVGGGSITFNDLSVQASAQVGIKNRVIDGGFILNQRVYVSGTSLPSGTYGHDRWKGGASAGTYTFTQGALGVNTTITITAGSIIQVIEGCNVAEGGTYVLSWTGTAQGRLNGGAFGSSGTVTVTGWVAGTNLNVEFNTGTCGSVQLEKGSTATSFDYRDYGRELIMCQRYLPAWSATAIGDVLPVIASGVTSTVLAGSFTFPVPTRVPVTGITISAASHFTSARLSTGNIALTNLVFRNTGANSAWLEMTCASGLGADIPYFLFANNAAARIVFNGAEL